MIRRTLAVVLAVSSVALAQSPPPTPVETVMEVLHGVEIRDDYRWLEALESESEAVRTWTTAQNDYTRRILDGLPGRAALERRLAELMSVGAVTAPTMRDDHYFYTERAGDQNQAVLLLREGHDGAPRVLLDPNTLDERGLYALDWFVPSRDGNLLAFGLSYAGSEMTVLHLMDVESGEWLADEIPGKTEFGGWAPDGSAFLYGVLEDPSDAYSRAWKWHEVGRHHRADPVLSRQEAPSRIPDARLDREGRWIVKTIFEGWSKQEISAIDAQRWVAEGEIAETPLTTGVAARCELQAIRGDTLYLLTTHEAPNGRVVAIDLPNPDPAAWRDVVPARDDAVIENVSEADGELVVALTVNASTRLERWSFDGRRLGEVKLPGLGQASISTHHDRTEAFVAFESFNEPRSIYRLDLRGGERTLWARPEVPVDPSLVEVEQTWCTSRDGAKVPMFVVHRKGLARDGRNPALVYGYGGFNVSILPRFRATDFPFLEAGGVYVSVNLRGGGEFGEAWHQAGMFDRKQNVFDDLYAATEHVVAEGWTSLGKIAVLGGSNGGLLTGVAATQRPDLYAAVISVVPLLDMVRFPDFLMARFWIPEYGDPAKMPDFEWLRAYSPYHNVDEGRVYPAMLITAGENDNRVHPMHARKMAALLQAEAGNDFAKDPIMLWVDRDAGHGQGKPLALRIRDAADLWSFVMWQTK